MLVGGFAEGRIKDIDAGYPLDRPSVSSAYDYDCDSDLEDEEAETLVTGKVPTERQGEHGDDASLSQGECQPVSFY